ncbi:MAG TPA: glycosyltransferase family 4 protein, partial [Longimicrobiaceae bacterium]
GWDAHGAECYVVPNAFVQAAADREPAEEGGAFTFLAAGRFSDYVKGADLLFRAFAAVHAAHPQARLVVASDEPRFEEILRPAERGAVTFTGWLDRTRLHAAMQAADVVVVPSRYEPFGLMAVEAMAMGTPVIAMAVGGLVEIVHHGLTGWLCPPGEGSFGLRLAMEEAVRDPRLTRALGRNARRTARREFSLARVAGLVRAHLDNALLEERRRSAYRAAPALSERGTP